MGESTAGELGSGLGLLCRTRKDWSNSNCWGRNINFILLLGRRTEINLSLVRQLVETDSTQTTGTLRVGRVAVMACLNIASQYVKLKQEFDDYRWDCEQRMVRLSEEIRAKLLSE